MEGKLLSRSREKRILEGENVSSVMTKNRKTKTNRTIRDDGEVEKEQR